MGLEISKLFHGCERREPANAAARPVVARASDQRRAVDKIGTNNRSHRTNDPVSSTAALRPPRYAAARHNRHGSRITTHATAKHRERVRNYLRNNTDKSLALPQTHAFLEPNEEEPLKAQDIFAQAPTGVYVAVGTERCLFGPAMNPRFSHVVMADWDPRVRDYNRINLALIAASRDRASYRRLRYATDHAALMRELERTGYKPDPTRPDLRDPKHFTWFRHETDSSQFGLYDDPHGPFAKVSYVHNDAAFERVKTLVDGDRIVVRAFDAGDPKNLDALRQELDRASLRISVYDISNSWWPTYIPSERSRDRRFVLGPSCFDPDGLVLLTDRPYGKPWRYVAFRRRDLARLGIQAPDTFADLFSMPVLRRRFCWMESRLGSSNMNRVVPPAVLNELQSPALREES